MQKSFLVNTETERSYEFDNVFDDIFIEPNIEEYTIHENK